MFLLTGNLLNGVTTFAGRFVGFYAGAVRSVVRNSHRSTAAWFHTSQMLMLKGFDESKMSFAFMF